MNDEKIHDIAVAYILKHSANLAKSATLIGAPHPSLVPHLTLAEGERVLVSAFFSKSSWYVFTTRRITSQFQGVLHSLDPCHGITDDFPNFKGFKPGNHSKPGAVPREVATICTADNSDSVRFEFETWEAAMAPIYAARYWDRKHPILHKLMTPAELEKYKRRV